jgi:hypothetical protein
MKNLYTLVLAFILATVVYGQPPIPNVGYNLSSGTPYSFTEWPVSSTIGSYPANSTLLTTFRTGPDEWATRPNSPNGRLGVWLCPYSLTGRSRFVGLDSRGIQFILTGSGQNILCNDVLPIDTIQSRPFAFNLGLNTNGISDAVVRYTVQVTQLGVQPTPRQASLALGYRTNLTDTFRLVPGATIFSTVGRAVNDSIVGTVSLPDNLLGQDLLQLAWIYYLPEVGGSGSRPYIRLDNISVTGTPTSVSKKSAFQFAVAPNPSQGAVKVTDSYNGKKQITVYNLLGAKVAEVNSETTVTELNIQTKGMYMLEVKHIATGETATKKLIVE